MVAALFLCASAPCAGAQTVGGLFSVDIQLRMQEISPPPPPPPPPPPNDNRPICISESLSQATGALVTVVCSNGQFVSISPRPGRPFAGTHGGAHRFNLPAGATYALAQGGGWAFGAGTVTTFRVMRQGDDEEFMELWVQF